MSDGRFVGSDQSADWSRPALGQCNFQPPRYWFRAQLVVSELIVAKLIVATIVFPIVTGSPPSITSHCMVVTEIMRGVLMTATDHGVASKRRMRVRPAVSAQGMATPPTTYGGHATVRSKSMKCSSAPAAMPDASAPTAMPAASATTPMPAATTPTAMSGDCRDVRHNAKRAHRNACRQNAYRSLLHRTSPLEVLKPLAWRHVDNRAGPRLIQNSATAAE
jgi:hypothetical protein